MLRGVAALCGYLTLQSLAMAQAIALHGAIAGSATASAVTNGQDVDEVALEAASSGRTVRIRLGANGYARVTDLPTEIYVSRVLAGEGEPKAADAAQQALAIAIRTFAAANVGRHRSEGFDLCDGTHCQVLRPSTPATRAAARATAGQVLTFEGRPAQVFYSASCGGRSEAPSAIWRGAVDLPYLRAADDDVHGEEDAWVVELPLSRVEQVLHRAGFDGRRLRAVDVEQRSVSGRASVLRLRGLEPEEIAADDFRLAVGPRDLRSTAFTVEQRGRVLRFTGRGYGQGVGMWVVGAGRRAARGETVAQILGQYFPGLHLESATTLTSLAPPSSPGESTSPTPPSSLEQLALRAHHDISAALGIVNRPRPRIELYDSLDAFRHATGRPWWITTVVEGTTIKFAPPIVIAQGDGLEAAVRRAVAEMLVRESLSGRHAWVRVGAARYYASTSRAAPSADDPKCPSDAELTMAVSAMAQRSAELRAEACFAERLARVKDWRDVR
jgi:stage II sporulation protein D